MSDSWLSTLKFLVREGPPPIELHNVQLGEERRPVDPDAPGVRKLPRKQVEVYFTPGFLPQTIITSYIEAAETTLDIMVYSFTLPSIADAVIAAQDRGVVVRVVLDNQQGSADYSVTDQLLDGGVDVVLDEQSGLMHNKVMVIDDKVVVTGSYNWSRSATARNRENFLVISVPDIVQKYKENFEEVWRTNQILRRES